MATLLDLEKRVAAKLGMAPSTNVDEKELIDSWINAGRDRVLLFVRPHTQIDMLALTAGVGDYKHPFQVLALHELTIALDRGAEHMTRHTSAEILDLRAGRLAASVTGEPSHYALEGDKLLVYPTPSSAWCLTFYYAPQPQTLAAALDDPSSPTFGGIQKEWHYAIELWACVQAGDQDDDTSSAMGSRYRQEFDAEVKYMHRWQSRRGGRRLPRVAIPGG